MSEGEAIAVIDRFVLQHRLPNGKTVLDQFLAARPSLRRWRLTGRHRIVPGHITPQNGYIQVG